jgi:site-specific DNA-methyltransferase (adenine-specific)
VTQLNPYVVSSILGAEIVGEVKMGHGQIDSLGDAQKMFDAIAGKNGTEGDGIDVDLLGKAFLAAREQYGDKRSTDYFIANPDRNRVFLNFCRDFGVKGADFEINKALLNARKSGNLSGLKSKPFSISYGGFAFASEFAATQLRYKTGRSIDDILCDPVLATQFDAIARKITPGHSSFEYRWAIFSIRKAWRQGKLPPKMPKFHRGFRLIRDPLDRIPEASGIYLLYENEQLLYARSTEHLRHGVELHRDPRVIGAISEKLWTPDPDNFFVDYARVKGSITNLRALERKLVEERQPIFNVPRSVA